jgi:hypothetical protein
MSQLTIPETSTFVQARYPDDVLVFQQIQAKAASLHQAYAVQPNSTDIHNAFEAVLIQPASMYTAPLQILPNQQDGAAKFPKPSVVRQAQIDQIQLYSGQLLGSP